MGEPARVSWLEQSQPERESQPARERTAEERQLAAFRYTYPKRPGGCCGGVNFSAPRGFPGYRRACGNQAEGRTGLCSGCANYERDQRDDLRTRQPEENKGPRKGGGW